MNIIHKFSSTSYVLLTLVLSAGALGCGIYFTIPLLLWIGAILLFTAFDCLGFHYLLTNEETVAVDKGSIQNASYRIMQGAFQIILTFALWLLSPPVAICFFGSWWLGLCDLLFYIVLRQSFTYKDMPWLAWTPYGFINKLLGFKIHWIEMVIFSLAAIAMSVLTLLNRIKF